MNSGFTKLTNTVYKILEFFPESDPLKNRAKDKALAIMDNLILINENSGWASFQNEKIKTHILEDIDMLLGYLWIAKSQGWLNSINFLIVSNEYEKIRKDIKPILEPIEVLEPTQKLPGMEDVKESIQIAPNPVLSSEGAKNDEAPFSFGLSDQQNQSTHEVTDRQRIIIDFLNKNGKAQVMDLQTVLPDITKRTIRRDLEDLLETEKIARFGEFNSIFYKIK